MAEIAAPIGVIVEKDQRPLHAVVRLARFEIGDLLAAGLIVPTEGHGIHVQQLTDRTVRHRVPVLPTDQGQTCTFLPSSAAFVTSVHTGRPSPYRCARPSLP